MAQKAISEYIGKKLIYNHIKKFMPEFDDEYLGVQITEKTLKNISFPKFPEGYVTKPDQLFGKRGKNKLIYANKSGRKALDWVKDHMNKQVIVKKNDKDSGIKGILNTFLIEPFIDHQNEYYVAFKTARDRDIVYVSTNGGIDIEDNWDNVDEFSIPYELDAKPIPQSIKKNIQDSLNNKLLSEFISALYQVFKLLDFTYLEINPITEVDGHIHILDLVARLDDTAMYKNFKKWTEPLNNTQNFTFPTPFGKSLSEAEKKINNLDERSGAALKFSILNPDGRVWLLASGGGASIILADTVGGLGYTNELANYTDFSGNPTTDESAEFTEIIIKEMLKSKAKNKVLVISGGIANFTDVKKTYAGVVTAIKNNAEEMRNQGIKIFVRRGGPNYKEGLKHIKEKVTNQKIDIVVHGPELYMTEIIALALSESKKKT